MNDDFVNSPSNFVHLNIMVEPTCGINPVPVSRTLSLNIISSEEITSREKYNLLFEKALSGLYGDVTNALIFHCWKTPSGDIGLIRDAKSRIYHKYIDDKWTSIENHDIIWDEEVEKFTTYIVELQIRLSKELRNISDDKIRKSTEMTLKRLSSLHRKLKIESYISDLIPIITDEITKVTIYQPYHKEISDIPICTTYNLFPGFVANKVLFNNNVYTKHVGLRRLLNHIYKVWAQEDNYLYWYCISWLAFPFRNLCRTNIGLILKGGYDSDKSLIFEFITEYVYGPNISTIVNDFESILEKFNGIVEGKMLICVDEINNYGCGKISSEFDKFKPKIIDNNIIIKREDITDYEVPNYASYAVCSDHKIPLRIEQGDRRFAVLETSNTYVGNTEYFNVIARDSFNKGTGDVFYSFLLSDLIEKHLVPLTPPPMTDAKRNIIKEVTRNTSSFFEEVFVYGNIPIAYSKIHVKNGKIVIPSTDLFELYHNWCQETKVYRTFNEVTFYTALCKFPGIHKYDIDGGQLTDVIISQEYYCSTNVEKVTTGTTDSIETFTLLNILVNNLN